MVTAMSVALGITIWRLRAASHRPVAAAESYAPLPRKVLAEVLNGGTTAGVAGIATSLLRHGGIDVVLAGNAPPELSGRTRNQVLVRRGDTTGVGRVIAVLGQADVIALTDSARLVDLTVVLGTSFRSSSPPVSPSH
jgi:hypothetical protein